MKAVILVCCLWVAGFLVGFVLGMSGKAREIERDCLYTNRMELTKGRVMECRYLDGVVLK